MKEEKRKYHCMHGKNIRKSEYCDKCKEMEIEQDLVHEHMENHRTNGYAGLRAFWFCNECDTILWLRGGQNYYVSKHTYDKLRNGD